VTAAIEFASPAKGLEAQIAAKEQELNTLVYALYGLTPEEIAYIQ
jgi:hypothetical protein